MKRLAACVCHLLLAGGVAVAQTMVNPELEQADSTATVRDFRMPRETNRTVSHLAPQLPFAYYPSLNTLEVAVALTPEVLPDTSNPPESVTVRVRSLPDGTEMAARVVHLGQDGTAQETIDLPNLPDGEYAVEYVIGGRTIRSPKTFKRIHFPWENNDLGEEHELYGTLAPVEVEGAVVRTAGRSYRMNAFGMFDSVVSLDRELLAGPIQLVCETAGGRAKWRNGSVAGRKEYCDLAEFRGTIESDALRVSSRTVIEEDGCAVVDMELDGVPGREIKKLWIEIPLRGETAGLFHFVADNGMRHNYAGATPNGGRIVWDMTQEQVPTTWRAVPGPRDGVIWDATQVHHRGDARYGERAGDQRPFVPYVWLGDGERGLAWFGESDRGYVVDYEQPVQVLSREGDRLVLRVYLVQVPTVLDTPRRVTFGLQASPTKPMEPDWRSRPLPTVLGPVVCWGGYICGSTYPENYDWAIVDKIQEARRTGVADEEWFRWRDTQRLDPDRLIHNQNPWIRYQLQFVNSAAASRGRPASTYFEEHYTDPAYPEWEVFQDEWSGVEFPRFERNQDYYGSELGSWWGVASPSYQDFTLWYANEWLRRGVSLYFDNVYPKRSYNIRFSDAYRDAEGRTRWADTILGQRRYYRRVYKLVQRWNGVPAPWRVDFTHHMTNTQVLPMHTWSTITLDPEQGYRTDDAGLPLPFPPEYTRVVTMSRVTGSIPMPLYSLRGRPTQAAPETTPHQALSDWGICRVHEMRNKDFGGQVYAEVRNTYERAWVDFGYGDPGIRVHNYWAKRPFLTVSDDRVKWIVLEDAAKKRLLVVLQGYRPEAVEATVNLGAPCTVTDAATGDILHAPDGDVRITMPADYGTRLFLVETGKD